MKKKYINKLCGDPNEIKQQWINIYGYGEYENIVNKIQRENKRRYLLIILLFIILLVSTVYKEYVSPIDIKLNDEGHIEYITRPNKDYGPKDMKVRVSIHTKKGDFSKNAYLNIEPEGNNIKNNDKSNPLGKESPDGYFDRKITTLVRDINSNSEDKRILLPDKLDNYQVTWKKQNNNDLVLYATVIIVLLFYIFTQRNNKIDNIVKSTRKNIIIELPEFINKLCLLLNSGLVFNRAIERIIENQKQINIDAQNYFYLELNNVVLRAKEKNILIEHELTSFAKRVQISEFTKIANIIYDSSQKGTDLKFALQRESDNLWFARKKHAEEEGKIAEIKLSIPLIILLGVLITITIAPAMMEM
ncbi:MAG: type II secretion system F family protein [Bacilli bacterium]